MAVAASQATKPVAGERATGIDLLLRSLAWQLSDVLDAAVRRASDGVNRLVYSQMLDAAGQAAAPTRSNRQAGLEKLRRASRGLGREQLQVVVDPRRGWNRRVRPGG